MDPLQSLSLEGHPRVETAGSASAVAAEGYATVKNSIFRGGQFYRPMKQALVCGACAWPTTWGVGHGCPRQLCFRPFALLRTTPTPAGQWLSFMKHTLS